MGKGIYDGVSPAQQIVHLEGRVNELEQWKEDVVEAIRDAFPCPTVSDGVFLVSVEKYNRLVKAVNQAHGLEVPRGVIVDQTARIKQLEAALEKALPFIGYTAYVPDIKAMAYKALGQENPFPHE